MALLEVSRERAADSGNKRFTATFPGKIGDALHQFVVMAWHWQQTGRKFDCWMDENTLKPLAPLFASQPCVGEVLLKPGITSWHMGGCPWDFGLSLADHAEREFVHLGFRHFPTRQITHEVMEQIPLHVERGDPKVLVVNGEPTSRRRLILHGNFTTGSSGVPGFWRFIADRMPELKALFSEIVFTGTAPERKRALEVYPDLKDFDDEGDFLNLAQFMSGASLVIGCGSSNVVLASLLGVPAVRVHDPIGEYPKIIWANLGPRQYNLTELELRSEWSGIKRELELVSRVTA